MDQEMVLCQKKDSVAMITLNRPDSKNAINTQIVSELEDIRNEINDTRVVIITGKGTFSSGTDIEEFSLSENKAEIRKRISIASIIDALDQPTIAAINGDALGQGLELALACDLRICTETAHFAMHHVTYGEIPWDGGTQRLSRLVGRGKAMEMILSGEFIDAQEAYRIGLVNKIVPPDELLTVVMDMAQKMASKGPIALKYAKEAICKGLDLSLEQGLHLEADLYFLLHTTRDRTEGITAFRDKRSPGFEGK
ncbi:MAG: enoyl-CoA hydratase/isomerase family protein [Desulfobacteraceae bacterium]|nr:enoyl-CoA hydratase/isomerase family protein [Desulfobacteraceae bacterium]